MSYLYEDINALRAYGHIKPIPNYIIDNLNQNFPLRYYQKEAFENFITYFEGGTCPHPTQVLFHMATGSGKTLIMAGLILYLYNKGYRNFLFFVNLDNVVKKTEDNFLNLASSKYLFADSICIDGKNIQIRRVENFQNIDNNAINLCFTTIQALHTDLFSPSENSITFEDFRDQKVVLISDEAHHLNVDTRNANREELEYTHSWESTINNILNKNRLNILLEFTATCDLENANIRDLYTNKIVYQYKLSDYYADKYSKEIVTYKTDLTGFDRMLQAVIINQYRYKVFQSNGLSIKPIILIKSNLKAENDSNLNLFQHSLATLTGDYIESLLNKVGPENELISQVKSFISDQNISYNSLAAEIRDDFSINHCLSLNDDKALQDKQILLNTLEDSDNPYRILFEVRKLDEGWDVLNLFDIVRMYDTRQGGRVVSKTTIQEAQLIGRGARYCPFQVDPVQLKFQRKYDDDLSNELRICETLYYYCFNDNKYVSELHNGLREIGLDLDSHEIVEYKLKEEFKATDVYQNGCIFINNAISVDRRNINELPASLRNDVYTYIEPNGASELYLIMLDENVTTESNATPKIKTLSIKDISNINYNIVNRSLRHYSIFDFDSLKRIFPNLSSTREFITDDKYLGSIKINISYFSNEFTTSILSDAVINTLGKIASYLHEINNNDVRIGTTQFTQKDIRSIFTDKKVTYIRDRNGGVGTSQNDYMAENGRYRLDLSDFDWFVYNDNFGTTEEKKFVAVMNGWIPRLREVYDVVYLIRNERQFHITSFDNGRNFEPDFVLLLRKNLGDHFEQIQVFIEPKGTHLIENDSWKQDFLLQINERAEINTRYVEDNIYKIFGFHFFNSDDENLGDDFYNDMELLFDPYSL